MFALLLMISCPFVLTACKKDKDDDNKGGGNGGGSGSTTIESVEIVGELKTNYFVGDELDIEGIQVKITKSDNSTETITLTANMISGFDTTSAGEKTLTVTYEEETATVVYYVVEPQITSIEVKEGTLKTDYFVGEALSVENAKLVVTYENSTTKEVAITSEMVSGFSTATAGTNKELTITHESKTVKVKYNITAVVATKITLESPITKNQYFEGETLDVAGGKIKVYYNNGTTKSVNITSAMVSGFNSATPKSATLTITYEGKSCTQSYTVIAIVLDKIEYVANSFAKTTYFEGEDFKVDGGKIKLTYNNKDTEEIPVTNAMISNYNKNVPGENKTLTITHEGKTTTASYTIIEIVATRLEVTSTFKTEYFEEDELDLTGGVIKVYFNNDTTKTIALDEANNGVVIEGFDSQFSTQAQIRIAYEEAEYYVDYVIKEVKVVSISATNFNKTSYYLYENYDPTGAKLILTYNNGVTEEEDITVDMLREKVASSVGTKTITITTFYENPNNNPNDATDDFLSATVSGITVNQKTVVISTPFTKTIYMVGEELDVSGAQLTVTYYTGFYAEDRYIEKTETVDVDASWVKNFNSDYVGSKLLTIEYQGFTIPSISYEVKTAIESIRLTSDFKFEYFTGESIDLTGGVITIVYNDGTPTATINLADENEDVVISGFDTTTDGPKTLTITYKGMLVSQSYYDAVSEQNLTRTAIPYTVTLLDVLSVIVKDGSIKTEYFVGDSNVLDLSNAKLVVTYTNGTTKEVAITESMIDRQSTGYPLDTSQPTYAEFPLEIIFNYVDPSNPYKTHKPSITYTVSNPV